MSAILLLDPTGSDKDTGARALAYRYDGAVYHSVDPIRTTLDTPAWHLARQIPAG